MALMDEACLNVGNTTDQMLLEHMDKKFKTNPHYASRSSDATTKKKNLELHQVEPGLSRFLKLEWVWGWGWGGVILLLEV